MNRVAAFEKVSYEVFEAACREIRTSSKGNVQFDLSSEYIRQLYEDIELPQRATTGSAGYDFHTPLPFILEAGESIRIPTGVRVKMQQDYVLMIFPRSGLGFKYRLQLDNTVGIIDSDYYYSNNEGHIIIKITNDTKENKLLSVERGRGFAQGIFLQYGITIDDDVVEKRDGGFGSTDNK